MRHDRFRSKSLLTGLLFLMLMTPLSAGAEPELNAVVQYRIDLMGSIQQSMRSMFAIIKGNIDHQDHLPGLAVTLNSSAKQSVDAFKINTHGKRTRKTGAKEDIWQDQEQFFSEIQSLVRESTSLVKLAESGDLQALKAQLGVVSKSCSSCHRKFRKK